MACDCVSEETAVVKALNKQLRTVNKLLRKQLLDNGVQLDEIFLALCATQFNLKAEDAMEELWATGVFDCGPLDYDFIVKHCIEQLRYDRESPDSVAEDLVS
jgi:hypothetical protein